MIFKYDALFGLEYISDTYFLSVDLAEIPEKNIKTTLETIARNYSEKGVLLYNSKVHFWQEIKSNYDE